MGMETLCHWGRPCVHAFLSLGWGLPLTLEYIFCQNLIHFRSTEALWIGFRR